MQCCQWCCADHDKTVSVQPLILLLADAFKPTWRRNILGCRGHDIHGVNCFEGCPDACLRLHEAIYSQGSGARRGVIRGHIIIEYARFPPNWFTSREQSPMSLYHETGLEDVGDFQCPISGFILRTRIRRWLVRKSRDIV